jgi:hypothetical protein
VNFDNHLALTANPRAMAAPITRGSPASASPSVNQRILINQVSSAAPSSTPTTIRPCLIRSYQKAEIEKCWPIIKAANIKAE